ncbi:MAG: LPP20 family lipoprotein [Treponema sp.]|nr:LPP20 family lipoprotein [Treponema sp.]
MLKIKHFAVFAAVVVLAVLFPAYAGASGKKERAEPEWVTDPYRMYNRVVYLAAVGSAPSRDTAEKTALINLTSIFGQSIEGESKANYTYSQAVEASSSSWSEKSDIAQAVKISAAMDTLIGAEIKDVWKSPDGTWYAAAVMDKAKTNLIYSELIQQNLGTITKLTSLSTAEKESFDGFINYYQAANLADANLVFSNVRTVISSGSMMGENLKPGNDYRLEAVRIARNIPIAVSVENDRQNRIKDAFSGVLTRAGFRTGGSDSRYVLRARLSLDEAAYPNTPYKWIRYGVDASLIDVSTGTVLFPYNINGREGHTSLSEAEARAVRAAEDRINEDYVNALGMFLSRNITRQP